MGAVLNFPVFMSTIVLTGNTAGFITGEWRGSPRGKHVSADYYYRIPVRPTYKSYPVYAPGHEPPGYMDWLKQQEPQIVWDDAGHAPALKTEADWIKAGEIVFESPVGIDLPVAVEASAARLSAQQELNDLTTVTEVREPAWYQKVETPISKDGTMPFGRYFIRKKGTVEFGTFSCATCHTRVMPDGSVLKGAQGNFPVDRSQAYDYRASVASAKTPRRLSATCARTSASSTQCLG